MGSKPSYDELWARAVTKYLVSTGRSAAEKALLQKLHTSDDFSKQLEAGRDEAWNTYLRSTGRKADDKRLLEKVKKLKNFSQPHKAEDLSDQLEGQHREFSSWREKHSDLTKTLKRMIGPYMFLSRLASAALSLSPFAPASVLLGAVTFLVQAAAGVSAVYDWIDELFVKLGDFTMRLEEYAEGGMGARLQEKVVDVLSCQLEILALSENAVKAGRWKQWAAVVFLGKDEDVKAVFEKLTKLFDDEQRLVIAISHATNQRVEKKVDSLIDSTERMGMRMERMNSVVLESQSETRVEQQRALLEKYLFSSAHNTSRQRYHEHVEHVLESSGEWLLAEDKFRAWTDREAQFLWISGGPGTGKSYLSSIAINHAMTLYPQDSEHPSRTSVAYFYVKEDDQELQSLGNILKSLAYQIAEVDTVYRSHVMNMLSRPDSVVTPRKIWDNLFLAFYQAQSPPNAALIVLDGLDEAPGQTLKDLFSLLDDVRNNTGSPVRLSLAFFSRPEVSEHFGTKFRRALNTVEIGEKNEADIGLYVKKHVTEILVVRETARLKSKAAAARLARYIRDKVMLKADGMFFKVVLIMNQLYDKERVSAIFDSIDSVPPQLDAMIARVFERLTSNEDIVKEDLRELLSLVSSAKRPLTISEIYAALKTRTGRPYDALESRLRGKFASLFRLTTKWSPQGSQSTPDTIIQETAAVEDEIFDIDDFPPDEDDEDQQDSLYSTDETETQAQDFEAEDGLRKDAVMLFSSTEVRFAHASIREFVVKPIRSDLACSAEKMGIAVDPRTAEFQMVRLCFDTVAKVNLRTLWNELTFNLYAASHLADHLMSLDPTVLSAGERSEVVRHLLEIFLHEDGLKKLIDTMFANGNKMLHQFFIDQSFVDNIRTSWLKQANEECCSPEELDWIARADRSRREFFRPLALEASKMWLTSESDNKLPRKEGVLFNHHKLFNVWIVYLFLKTDDNVTNIASSEIGGFTAFLSPACDLECLDKIVNLAKVDKTAYYYASYGDLQFLSGDHDAALEKFNKAIELDCSSWTSFYGASKCLVKQKKYDQAATRLQEAMELVPPDSSDDIADVQANLLALMISKKDYQSAVDYAKHAYEKYPDAPRMCDYIRCLYAVKEFEGIVNTVKHFLNSKDGAYGSAFFGLRDVSYEISGALSCENSITLIQPMVSQTLEMCDSQRLFTRGPWLAAHVAEFMYDGYEDTTASMELFERILRPNFKSSLRPESQWAYNYPSGSATEHLAMIYYDKAVNAHSRGEDSGAWVEKLRKLAIGDDKRRSNVAYKMNHCAYMLGVFLRKYAKCDETEWKACFRYPILESLDLLEDVDPLNGIDAYLRLEPLLMAAGDVRNASAAGAVVLTEYLDGDDAKVRKALGAINFQGSFWKCLGLCTTMFTDYNLDYSELYTCTECLGTFFCQDCLPLLKRGKMPGRKCNPKHEFIQMLPVPEEVKGVAARFDGKTMQVQQEWLDALRKVWS